MHIEKHNPRKVIISREEIAAFNATWPGSSLRSSRSYWFEFGASGDLVDCDVPEHDDGPAAAALAEDARDWLEANSEAPYFTSLNYDGSAKVEREGFALSVELEPDTDHGAPWEECDGHGPVSDWRPVREGSKRPGEWLLHVDHGSARYYDFAAACKQALAEGWGYTPGKLETEAFPNGQWRARFAPRPMAPAEHCHVATAATENEAIAALYAAHRATMSSREYAAKAAKADFEYLKAWCDDQWCYVGVVVTASREGVELGSASLWGIESNAGDYLLDVANELAPEALEEARSMIAKLAVVSAS